MYNRDLRDGEIFETVGGKQVKIRRDSPEEIYIGRAKIVESEVFVYNLGTMFFIDDVLDTDTFKNDVKPTLKPTSSQEKRESESSEDYYTTENTILDDKQVKLTTRTNREPTTSEYRSILSLLSTRSDVELVPSAFSEFAEEYSISELDVTPKALPLFSSKSSPPK